MGRPVRQVLACTSFTVTFVLALALLLLALRVAWCRGGPLGPFKPQNGKYPWKRFRVEPAWLRGYAVLLLSPFVARRGGKENFGRPVWQILAPTKPCENGNPLVTAGSLQFDLIFQRF